jgi:hypothetical protein
MIARPSTTAMTEMPALNPVVCVTSVFRCEDSAVEEEGEVDVAMDAEAEEDAVAVEFVSALKPHSPQDVWHPTPQYVSSPPQYPWDEQQLPHLEPVQIKPADPPHEPVVLIEELTL